MAHKTLVNGTVYEISGGKTKVNGTAYSIDKGKTLVGGTAYEVGFVNIDPVLNNNEWATISEVASSGQAANYWAVGDCKAITLNGTIGTLALSNYETYVYIIGFDHNGANNTIDFGTFKTALTGGVDVCLVNNYMEYLSDGTKTFNLSHWGNNVYGGWKGCDMRYDILGSTDNKPSGYGAAPLSGRIGYDASENCATNPVVGTLMAALPSELRNVMKPMVVYSDNVGSGTATSNVTASIDYLPLLAEFELYGKRTRANSEEQNHQKQYSYYSAGNSNIKYKYNEINSYACNWWLRSVYSPAKSGLIAGYDGSVDFQTPYRAFGIAPIFRV